MPIGSEILEQLSRTLLLALVPSLFVSVASFAFCFLQGMIAVREESMQYSLRVVALIAIVVLFGFSVSASFVELMRMALR